MRLDKNDPLRFAKKRVFGLNRQALKSAGAALETAGETPRTTLSVPAAW